MYGTSSPVTVVHTDNSPVDQDVMDDHDDLTLSEYGVFNNSVNNAKHNFCIFNFN